MPINEECEGDDIRIVLLVIILFLGHYCDVYFCFYSNMCSATSSDRIYYRFIADISQTDQHVINVSHLQLLIIIRCNHLIYYSVSQIKFFQR